MTLINIRALGARTALVWATLVGSLTFVSCSGTVPPFSAPIQELRGFKSRTFRGTPEELRPAVIETLREVGFEVHAGGEDLKVAQ